MLYTYDLLPKGLEESLFDFAQLGVVSDPEDRSQHTYIVKLFQANPEGKSPVEVAHTLDGKCHERAATTALCKLYSRACGVTFDLFWAEKKPQKQLVQI